MFPAAECLLQLNDAYSSSLSGNFPAGTRVSTEDLGTKRNLSPSRWQIENSNRHQFRNKFESSEVIRLQDGTIDGCFNEGTLVFIKHPNQNFGQQRDSMFARMEPMTNLEVIVISGVVESGRHPLVR